MPDVPLFADHRLTRVQAHADTQHRSVRPGVRGELSLGRDGCRDRVAGAPEREEERVTLCVHLDAVPVAEFLAEDSAMLGDHVGVLVAEPLQELGRALDVGEDERDRAMRHRRARALFVRAARGIRIAEHSEGSIAPHDPVSSRTVGDPARRRIPSTGGV